MEGGIVGERKGSRRCMKGSRKLGWESKKKIIFLKYNPYLFI